MSDKREKTYHDNVKYNGYTNYITWLISNWVTNEEKMYYDLWDMARRVSADDFPMYLRFGVAFYLRRPLLAGLKDDLEAEDNQGQLEAIGGYYVVGKSARESAAVATDNFVNWAEVAANFADEESDA